MAKVETHQVRAEYRGYVDLGAACFSVPLVDLKPESTCRNRIVCRSRIGDEFKIGETYDAVVRVTRDGKTEFEVVALV